MPLSQEEIVQLIQKHPNEKSWLDYKQEYYSADKNADLIHDLLAMANLLHEQDRYILFGVNDAGKIVGLDKKLSDVEINNTLKNTILNRPLPIDIYNVDIEDKTIGIIQIGNDFHKPFFLLKDYTKKGKTIRSGVVYSRYHTNNTAIDETTPESDISDMWKERFGLTLPPKERVGKLVKETNRWLFGGSYEDNSPSVWYHFDHPEYTIELRHLDSEEFYEPWLERMSESKRKMFPKMQSQREYRIKYFTTTLAIGYAFHPRHTLIPLPKVVDPEEYEKTNKEMNYIIRNTTEEYYVCAICLRENRRLDGDDDYSAPRDRLAAFSQQLFEDIQVMIGSGVITLER